MIYNRLREGMPLGIDATTRFATGNYTQPLTESELAVDSPYNTRTNAGLPPGPITSPGLASIEAAAHPAKVDYLYYVVEPGACSEHAFSSTEAEFEADVARYNAAREAAGGELAGQLRGIAVARLAVLGHPVGHSRSPAMHNAALAELGLGDEWSYEAIEVAPDAFEARVRAMPGEGFAGANVTVPHKGAALSLADELSETAREIGAANTLVFAGRRDPRRQHRRRAACWARCRARRPASGRWCWAPAAPPAPWSGRCCARGPRSRSGTAPSCAPSTSARSWAESRSRPRPGRLRADRQHDRGRPRRRGPVRRAAA